MSDYERKYRLATAELENAGLQEKGVTPLTIRILRKIGCKPKPSYYRTPLSRFAYDPLVIGGAWGVPMFLISGAHTCSIALWVLASALFGYSLIALSEITVLRQSKRQKLSRWEDF